MRTISGMPDWTFCTAPPPDADRILRAVRGQWGIENSHLRVLDLSYGEDQFRIRPHNAPNDLPILRPVALNPLQKAKTKRQFVKRLPKVARWDDQTLETYCVNSYHEVALTG